MRNIWLGALALFLVLSGLNLAPWSDVAGEQGKISKPMGTPHPLASIRDAHWLLDEGSGQYANDTSGYDNDGTLGSTPGVDSNDPAWTTGISNSALAFNEKHFVTVPDDASLDPSFISVEAWVNPAGYGYYRSFIMKNYYGSGW